LGLKLLNSRPFTCEPMPNDKVELLLHSAGCCWGAAAEQLTLQLQLELCRPDTHRARVLLQLGQERVILGTCNQRSWVPEADGAI
jgi:hypothetical protein